MQEWFIDRATSYQFTVSASTPLLCIFVMQLLHISGGHPLPACLLHVVHCGGKIKGGKEHTKLTHTLTYPFLRSYSNES